MNKSLKVAILGATGLVGEEILKILEQRQFPVSALYPLASERSVGETVLFNHRACAVRDVATFDFSQADLAFFSAGSEASARYAPIATQAGCVVIDNSDYFRQEADVPLVIPEVNKERIADYQHRKLIANPNCSTIQMLVALKPIYDAVGITRVNVATYQSVSGKGKEALEELVGQTREALGGETTQSSVFSKPIAFNLLPHIDQFEANGYTKEEMKMVWETQKILQDPLIGVNATAVRVPVFYGHSEAIHLETKKKITATEARGLLRQAPGVMVIDEPIYEAYPTPRIDILGEDAVYVGRIREDISCERGLNLWVVSDNVRKGAALNAVQIAESLVEQYL